jgi:DNA mismatch endonuclease, patch repair protein
MAKHTTSTRQAATPGRWDAAWSASVTEEQHRRMAAIGAKDTLPERVVRRIVHRLGYRFRLHRRELPGCPDLVFPSLGKIIDVRGCYWHAHKCQRRKRRTVRLEYWVSKLERNVARDRANLRRLRRQGWDVLVIWECQVKDTGVLARRLGLFLSSNCRVGRAHHKWIHNM